MRADGGSTWAPSNNGLPSKAAYRFDRFVSGAGDSPVLYVHANPVAVPTQPVEQASRLYRSDDSGRTWAPIGPPNASALLEAGRGFLRDGSRADSVLVDLSEVEETDSSALSVVFGWVRTARNRGVTLLIAHPPASMVSQAALYGVSDSLPLA